jgi:hypothetical protein
MLSTGAVDSMMYVEAIDKYVTCSRDGSWRLWNGADLKHFRTMTMGSSWITDCLYMPTVGECQPCHTSCAQPPAVCSATSNYSRGQDLVNCLCCCCCYCYGCCCFGKRDGQAIRAAHMRETRPRAKHTTQQCLYAIRAILGVCLQPQNDEKTVSYFSAGIEDCRISARWVRIAQIACPLSCSPPKALSALRPHCCAGTQAGLHQRGPSHQLL